MSDIIQKKMLEPAKLYLSKPGTFAQYREMLLKKGYSIGQIKPVTVITNETQREFFFSMIEEI